MIYFAVLCYLHAYLQTYFPSHDVCVRDGASAKMQAYDSKFHPLLAPDQTSIASHLQPQTRTMQEHTIPKRTPKPDLSPPQLPEQTSELSRIPNANGGPVESIYPVCITQC